MDADGLEYAGRALRRAVLQAEDLPDALAQFADASGSLGALILATGGGPTRIVESATIADPVAKYLAGEAPYDPRQTRVQIGPARGFATDLEDFTPSELEREPFYQEFLRPHGILWHACAWVDGDDATEVAISLKRSPRQGAFARSEADALDRQLPGLQSAFALRRALGPWRDGVADAVLDRGSQALAWLDRSGRVVAASERFEAIAAGMMTLTGESIATFSQSQQRRLDAALVLASGPTGRNSALVLANAAGERFILRCLPVPAGAGELLGGRAILLVASPLRSRTEPPDGSVGLAIDAFGLTFSEARVAVFVACGWPIEACAIRLGISTGTARNHLKAALAKTETSRQIELAILIRPLLAT